jgi:hypothetical protein
MLHLQPRGNANAGALSVRNRVHDLAAAIRAIPTRKKLWVRSLASRTVNEDTTAFQLNLRVLARFTQKTRMRTLPNRQNNKIRFKRKLRASFRDD